MATQAQFSFAISEFKQYEVDKVRNTSVRNLPTQELKVPRNSQAAQTSGWNYCKPSLLCASCLI